MPLLLGVTGALLLLSGATKWRAGTRIGVGLQPLTTLELVVGLAAWALAASGQAAVGAARWIVPGGVVLVVASSAVFVLRHREARRRRGLSEGRRLESYVRYSTKAPDGDGR